ncbi:hypothetical protein BGZ67_002003 [Mortierella alpina]|nr:hypothetical protein BGZ67_002003 [Mortierella alpina]
MCLVFDASNGSKAYALVKNTLVPILVQAVIPAADPQSFNWEFVSAGWPFQESYHLEGSTASCIMNKAGELIAMGSWSGDQPSSTKVRRGLVYNPYNPLPIVEGRQTSNALWMEINTPANINNTENEKAQLMIDTGTLGNSAIEIALTRSHLLVRSVLATGSTLREMAGLGGWTLPRPLNDASTAQLKHSNNLLYVFSANGANDTSLVRIPFNPRSTTPGQIFPGLPKETTSIDISTASKCNWSSGYSTAVSDNKFYLLCKEKASGTQNFFVYDNKADDQNPKLGAAVPVIGLDPQCKINLFQPLGNRTFAMLGCEETIDPLGHSLLSLSGSNVGAITRLTNSKIWISHDTLFNNILPGQDEILIMKTDGIDSNEGIIGLVFGVLGVLFAIVFLTLRYRRRQRSKKNREKDAETSSDSFGLVPLGTSANTHLSPTVYAAPQVSIPPSPAMSAGLPVSSWPTSPPTAADAATLSSSTLSPAPSDGSPSVPTSGSPPANTYQMELQQLGFSSHPRPNIVTTVND